MTNNPQEPFFRWPPQLLPDFRNMKCQLQFLEQWILRFNLGLDSTGVCHDPGNELSHLGLHQPPRAEGAPGAMAELPPLPPKTATRDELIRSFRGPTKRSNWVVPGRWHGGRSYCRGLAMLFHKWGSTCSNHGAHNFWRTTAALFHLFW